MTTERRMLDLLHTRYGKVYGNGRRYVVGEHVRSGAGWARGCADVVVMDLWQSSGLPFYGFEVKVSRSDWLRELADPEKAEEFRRYMSYWWLVVPSADIVRDDLPEGWGLLVAAGNRLIARVQAPKLDPDPMPKTMTAALLRSVAKTAEQRAARHLGGQQQ